MADVPQLPRIAEKSLTDALTALFFMPRPSEGLVRALSSFRVLMP